MGNINFYNKKNPQFWSLNLEENNIKDLKDWIENNQLIGLVDEKEGGIIGYIQKDLANKIIIKLNKEIK